MNENLENMEVCNVGWEDGCGDQDKDNTMVTTENFRVLE